VIFFSVVRGAALPSTHPSSRIAHMRNFFKRVKSITEVPSRRFPCAGSHLCQPIRVVCQFYSITCFRLKIAEYPDAGTTYAEFITKSRVAQNRYFGAACWPFVAQLCDSHTHESRTPQQIREELELNRGAIECRSTEKVQLIGRGRSLFEGPGERQALPIHLFIICIII